MVAVRISGNHLDRGASRFLNAPRHVARDNGTNGAPSIPGSQAMGSFKAGGREQGPNRRRDKKNAKRQGSPRLEWLEGRVLLSGDGGGNPVWKPTSTNLADVQNGPM